jgi:peptidoglycan/xylan/chitin deacetylase (PgdA/CDA1 family)
VFRFAKSYIVLVLACLFYYSGLLRLYQILAHKPFAVILNYHRILMPEEREYRLLPAMYVFPETFEKHLQYLARHYQVVTMQQLMDERSSQNSHARPLCVITFDDGWSDNYHYALPLLRKYGMPATLFISTDFIDSDRVPWFYDLLRSLHLVSRGMEEGTIHIDALHARRLPESVATWAGLPDGERLEAVECVIESMKLLPVSRLAEVLDTLSKLTQDSSGQHRSEQPAMLSWDNVREMHNNGFEIGSHSVTHWILTRISADQLEHELVQSKRTIESELKEPIQGFSYPNGDYSDHVIDLLQNAGYTYACTIKPGHVERHSAPFELHRLLLHNENTYTTPLFACHMAGLFNRGRE